MLSAAPASAQSAYNCPAPSIHDVATCTIPAGTSTTGVAVDDTVSGGSQYDFTNDADILVDTSQTSFVVKIEVDGESPSGDAEPGVVGGTVDVTNNGNITISGSSAPINATQLSGIVALASGGDGSDATSKGDGGRGGDGGTISVTNTGAITIDGSAAEGLQTAAVGISAVGNAGAGGDQDSGSGDQVGGNSGDAKVLTVTNSAAITIGSSDDAFAGYDYGRGISVHGQGSTGGQNNGSGGSGAEVTVTNSGAIGVYWDGQDGAANGITGLYARSTGSDGIASTDNSDDGGKGEDGKEVTVTNSADITVDVALPSGLTEAGDLSAGIYVLSEGGDGGESADKSTGGVGGSASTLNDDAGTSSVHHGTGTIETSGPSVMGIVALSKGGDGGDGNSNGDSTGGAGGVGGAIEVKLVDNGKIITHGDNGYAILGQSIGGIGGSNAGQAGTGGNGGTVTVNAASGTSITTDGDFANGVTVHSVGGGGGVGDDFTGVLAGSGGNGGNGGRAAKVEITSGATITTNGQYAHGLLAQSIGGAGGAGGIGEGLLLGLGGAGGDGGQGGNALANNTGNVTTNGNGANAIVAQSLAGGGGAAGMSGGVLSLGGDAGNSGSSNSGVAQITSNGDVTTTDDAAIGMLAQAIGGGGGSAAGSAGIFTIGGTGSSGGMGGAAQIFAVGGTTKTSGEFSHGLVAQSVGGGGGSGGNVIDVSVGIGLGIGGSGTGGGDGGEACVTNIYTGCGSGPLNSANEAPALSSSAIHTTGDFAFAAIAQSVGGGGGNGGNVTGVGLYSEGSFQIGGSSVSAGSGGVVTMTFENLTASTSGDNAIGLLAQSVGGGGGNGGNATAVSDDDLVDFQVGGNSTGGGKGGNVSLDLTNGSVTTTGSHAAAVVAQSIGGGGGTGGAASGKDAGDGFSFVTSIGAGGGVGGVAGAASTNLSSVSVTTGMDSSGDPIADAADAIGVLVQSIGGGGGIGGSSVADAVTLALPDFEGESFAASIAISVSGKGGAGGTGGAATAVLTGSTTVETGGAGSHGVVAQSISDGGGNAGSADALSATVGDADTISAKVTTAIGNKAGNGGNSGTATVHLQDSASVVTHGDHANAVVAQSITGGGGNGGVGSASNDQLGGGYSLDAQIGLGGEGGSGGTPGEADVALDSGTSIATYGSGSRGILAQGIGGGGGASQGGTVGLALAGGSEDGGSTSLTGSVSVGVGGGQGDSGGAVNVTVDGTIATAGGDADAIMAQSIGGGGGLGGSVGNDAGSVVSKPFSGLDQSTKYQLTTSLGGKGGTGGDGGAVSMTLANAITTQGDWADGIVAQSIGGGGGAGGTSTVSGSKATADIGISIGGFGGVAGHGGAVTVDLDDGSSITTEGYAAQGILMQSIGGGGGQGADGSDSAYGKIGVGGGIGGSGGASGGGGAVTLAGDGTTTVTTHGDDAYGILAQSIGGGGGIGGAGNTTASTKPTSHSLDVAVGGYDGAGDEGGTVNLSLDTTLMTHGDRAFGIVAQSIGGGGGVGGAASSDSLASVALGGDGSNGGNGGNVTLDVSGSVTTHGAGAHGIIAQSIGGGGGIAGDASGGVNGVRGLDGQTGGNGDSGAVTVTFDGTLTTTGTRAHGIIAQAIAGGGGIIGDASGVSFGSAFNEYGEFTDPVIVTQSGTLVTSGEGSMGIFAQSQAADNPDTVTVNVNGAVTGGTGSDGAGVFVSDGSQNALNIAANASIAAGDDDAYSIVYDGGYSATDGATLDIYNSGTITGDISLVATDSNSAGTLHNQNGGTYTPDGATAADIANAGTVDLTAGSANGMTAKLLAPGTSGGGGVFTLTGDYVQTRTGHLRVEADFLGGTASRLEVGGDASLGGTVDVRATSLLKGVEIPVLTADGTLSGDMGATDTRAVVFDTKEVGNAARIVVSDTRFADAFGTLSGNERSVGGHLDAIFDSRSRRYAVVLAQLAALAETDDTGLAYARAMASLAPGASQAMAAAQSGLARARLDGAMRCPTPFGATSGLVGESCVWADGGGSWSEQDGIAGYDGTTWGLGGGAQTAFGEAWIAGGTAGFENGSYDSADGLSRADGTTGYLAAALGRRFGAFTLTGAVSGSWGAFDTKRRIGVPGFAGTAKGQTDVATLGGRVRAAYRLANAFGYVQPMVDLDLLYTHTSGYDETGAGIYNLDVAAQDQLAFIATPAVEIGASAAVGAGWAVGGFAIAGVSLSTEDEWETEARLQAAPVGAGAFTATLPIADVVGHLGLGLSLGHQASGFDARVEYNGAFGDDYQSHGGFLRITKTF
ncbi:autotransporter outer membrane beta-barrel domain-containing protein [Acuticoccus sediminis]|uniref:autotransporter outer membrane beta-barrel domain-containing protein n=1 Tax=Acuticoccus sediminis TaxID=2184697 RepID=UPI001CFC9BE9|nr:autotransporter outer membrane beta-barrel domain-containing protein [Acuticoccus sediminis]